MTRSCRHRRVLHQECWRRFRQQGGGTRGSRHGVKTRSCCPPWLCSTISDWLQGCCGCWQPTHRSPRLYGEKGKWRVNMWCCMGSLVQLRAHALRLKKKGPSLDFWLFCGEGHPTQVTWWGGRGLSLEKTPVSAASLTPVMNCGPTRKQQDPLVERVYTSAAITPSCCHVELKTGFARFSTEYFSAKKC